MRGSSSIRYIRVRKMELKIIYDEQQHFFYSHTYAYIYMTEIDVEIL